MTAQTYKLHVQSSLSAMQALHIAAEIGRESGRDNSWTPTCLNEALFEILMFDDDERVFPSGTDGYTLPIVVDIVDEELLRYKCGELRCAGKHAMDIEYILAKACMMSESPCDLGFEIIEACFAPDTGHTLMEAGLALIPTKKDKT